MNKIFIVSLILMILCGCFDQKNLDDTLYLDSDGKGAKRVSMREFVSGVELYPLDTTGNFLLGRVDKLLVTDSLFFVLDNRYTKTLFSFTHSGKGLNKFFNVGRGALEYTNIEDLALDTSKQQIIILAGIKLIYLDFELKPLKEVVLNQFYDKCCWENDRLLLYCHHLGELSYFDEIDNKVKLLQKVPTLKNFVYTRQQMFYRLGDTCFFSVSGVMSIFSINNLNVKKWQDIDYKYKDKVLDLYTKKSYSQLSSAEIYENPVLEISYMGSYRDSILMFYSCPQFWCKLVDKNDRKSGRNFVMKDFNAGMGAIVQQENYLFATTNTLEEWFLQCYSDVLKKKELIYSENPILIKYTLNQ